VITTVTAPVTEVPVDVNETNASVVPTLAATGVNVALLVTTTVFAVVIVEAVFTSTPAIVTFKVVADANANVKFYTDRLKKLKKVDSKCPHCGKEGGSNMKRFHFDNCKQK